MKPNTLELFEKSIISACFDGKLHDIVSYGITAKMFLDPHYKEIFKAVLQNDILGNVCDLTTIGTIIVGDTERVNKAIECTDSMSSTQNLDYTLSVVKNAFNRRVILKQIYEIYQDAVSRPQHEENDIEAKLASLIYNDDVVSKNEFSNRGLTVDTLTAIEKDIEKGGIVAVKTGVDKLDKYLEGGFKPGQLTVIAARTGVGKTTFATNIAVNASLQGFKPHYFTIEMNAKEIMQRFFCTVGLINTSAMSSHKYTDDEMDRLANAAQVMQKVQISVNATTGGSWEKLETSVNVVCKYHGANCIIIDYIQQYRPSQPMPIREQINHMTSRCKFLAQKYNVPFIVVAQLNREIEKRANKVPIASDLKESGSIEQDSDNVIMLYRLEDDELWARIAKNRNGQTGDIRLNADLSKNKFYSTEPNEWSNRV